MVNRSCSRHICQLLFFQSMNCATHQYYDKEMDGAMNHCTYCHNECLSTARMNLTKQYIQECRQLLTPHISTTNKLNNFYFHTLFSSKVDRE